MVFLSSILRAAVSKQSLMTLRKNTGHSFQNCRKALEQNNNDLDQAVKWLQAESLKHGWTKLETSSGRSTQQGVLALANSGTGLIAVTEVNCETDFVARNEELRGFAHKVSQTLCQVPDKKNSSQIQSLPWDEISKLLIDGQSVEEGRARLVAKVGEKLGIRQSLVVSAGEGDHVAASCHPETGFGKYCAALLYKGGDNDVATKICRHIIGMKPVSIGKMEDSQKEVSKMEDDEDNVEMAPEAKDSQPNADSDQDEEMLTPSRRIKEDEGRLLMQDFVFDPETTVGQLLEENNMQITKFWRFECAAEVIESKD